MKVKKCSREGCNNQVHLFGECYHHYYTMWEKRNKHESKK